MLFSILNQLNVILRHGPLLHANPLSLFVHLIAHSATQMAKTVSYWSITVLDTDGMVLFFSCTNEVYLWEDVCVMCDLLLWWHLETGYLQESEINSFAPAVE